MFAGSEYSSCRWFPSTLKKSCQKFVLSTLNLKSFRVSFLCHIFCEIHLIFDFLLLFPCFVAICVKATLILVQESVVSFGWSSDLSLFVFKVALVLKLLLYLRSHRLVIGLDVCIWLQSIYCLEKSKKLLSRANCIRRYPLFLHWISGFNWRAVEVVIFFSR